MTQMSFADRALPFDEGELHERQTHRLVSTHGIAALCSAAAERSVRPSTATMREAILVWLRMNGPATDERMQEALGLNPSTQRPRRIELVRAGQVVESGAGVTRSGRSAALWIAR